MSNHEQEWEHEDLSREEVNAPGAEQLRGGAEGRSGAGGVRAPAASSGPSPEGPAAAPEEALAAVLPVRRARRRTRRTTRPEVLAEEGRGFTPQERLLMLDVWQRSKMAASEFSGLTGVSVHALYTWKKRFEQEGPAGLVGRKRGVPKGSRLPEPTRRAILMLKRAHPDWGRDRIHDELVRAEGLEASSGAIGRALEEEGYVVEEGPSRARAPRERRFERARPNELWQSDLFTFVLRRHGVRMHVVVFLDDHSRFVVGFGLHATASGALVKEAFEAAVARFGAPREVLTDRGPQYASWRGKSAFTRWVERRGVRHVLARARHPQTVGKTERFWQTLWRECLEQALFRDIDDARRRVALYLDHYNFQRPHQSLGGLVPADRFFEASEEVKAALASQVAKNALEMARGGVPRKPFYLAGRVGGEGITLHGEDGLVVLQREGVREEVDLEAPGRRARGGEEPALPEAVAPHGEPRDHAGATGPAARVPGTSALDEALCEAARRGRASAPGEHDALPDEPEEVLDEAALEEAPDDEAFDAEASGGGA